MNIRLAVLTACVVGGTTAVSAETVTHDMVACKDRQQVYDLAKAVKTRGSDAFMAEAGHLVAGGQCRFLTSGTAVTVVDTHWLGTACVSGDGLPGCLWIVKSALSE